MKTKALIQTGRTPDQMAFSVIGSLWMLGWCLQKHAQDLSTLCVVLIAGAAVFLWAWCNHRASRSGLEVPGARRFRSTRGSSVGPVLEGLLCGGGLLFNLVFVLELFGHLYWLQPVLILFTSLACLALGKAARHRTNYVTGLTLLAVALAYPLVFGAHTHATGCFATGSILWLSTLYGLFVDRFNADRVDVSTGRRLLVLSLH